jgi:hypothetical protein
MMWTWTAVLAVVVIAGVALIVLSRGSSSPKTTSTNASSGALLASVDSAATGQTVDGIPCQNTEQLLFHVHAHLAIYVDGASRSIPEGIGIAPPRQSVKGATGQFVVAGSCFYWLHGHTDDGVIHIEAPTQRTFTLGNYFDIWGQPLSASRIGPATGTVIAYVDGERFTGDPRTIPIGAHTKVQLDVGRDVAFQAYTFAAGL